MTDWIYLSPHLDDAVLSCGARIWQQVRAGDSVAVWTLCAGDPPTGVSIPPLAIGLFGKDGARELTGRRRDEDRDACARLGAGWKHFTLADSLYRRDTSGRVLYPFLASLREERARSEDSTWRALGAELQRELPGDAELVFPLAIGNHVDHQFVRWLAEERGTPCWFYADVPYVLEAPDRTDLALPAAVLCERIPVEPDGLDAWIAAIFAYRSQVAFWWKDEAALRRDLVAWTARQDGHCLWRWPGATPLPK